MKVVRPIEITEAVLTASSIPEPDASVGEIEWQDDRFDGYNVSANVAETRSILKSNENDDFFILDSSAEVVYRFNSDFVYQSEFSVSAGGSSIVCAGCGPSTPGSNQFISVLRVGATIGVDRYDSAGSKSFGSDLKPDLDSEGVTLNAIGLTATYAGVDDYSIYFLNKESDTLFKVIRIKSGGASPGVVFNQIIDIKERTPVDINYRNGQFSIMYSSENKGTEISTYNETFTEELSSNKVSGLGFDAPYNGYTIGAGNDYKLIKSAGVKVYNVDSDFNNGGIYKPQDRVIKASTHKLYECTIATFDDPEVGVDKKPQTWVEAGYTNKWAAFDDKKSTKSKSSSPYTIQLVPGVTIDSLAGFAISGATDVTIIATSASAGEVFNETINLLNIDLAYDFYTWYTYELDYIDEFVVTNIPPYPDLTIDISFTGTAIEIGNIVTGRGRNLGVLQTGVISDRVDYSRTTIDDFGEETTVIRPITKYSTYPIVIEKVQAPGVLRFLDGLRGLKCVWIGDIGNGQNLTTFGSIERSPLTYDTLSISEYQIKVRGSI